MYLEIHWKVIIWEVSCIIIRGVVILKIEEQGAESFQDTEVEFRISSAPGEGVNGGVSHYTGYAIQD